MRQLSALRRLFNQLRGWPRQSKRMYVNKQPAGRNATALIVAVAAAQQPPPVAVKPAAVHDNELTILSDIYPLGEDCDTSLRVGCGCTLTLREGEGAKKSLKKRYLVTSCAVEGITPAWCAWKLFTALLDVPHVPNSRIQVASSYVCL